MSTWAVIGAGNGGQAFAGYIASKGYDVRLFDLFQETTDKINQKGYIQLSGAIEAQGTPSYVGTDLQRAVEGADIVMVVNPSIYHKKIAASLAPYLKPNQIVFLSPPSTFGAFAFKKVLRDVGADENIVIAESDTLLFACRLVEAGHVHIGGMKDRILVSTIPSNRGHEFYDIVKPVIPNAQLAVSVLQTSLNNLNPMVHPIPTMMNANWIESGRPFEYYIDGIGETLGNFIYRMDQERVAIGQALGLELGETLFDFRMQYECSYPIQGETVSEMLKSVDAYRGIYAPDTVHCRYIYEDIPNGLVPLVAMGQLLGLETKCMETGIKFCELLLNEDFVNYEYARNLKALGLDGMSREDVLHYAETGKWSGH